MGFLKKKTATAQWEYEKEQARAELAKREPVAASKAGSISTTSSWPPPEPQSTLQQIPQGSLALPLPDLLSGIAVCELVNGRFKRSESGSNVFDCVAVAAQFGVDLLHSRKGFSALVKTGTEVLANAMDENIRCRGLRQASSHAIDYLRRITDAFPVIAVYNLKAMNARTNKGRWEVPQDRMFPPHHAAVIELNQNVSDQ